jgi:hypothetical protein
MSYFPGYRAIRSSVYWRGQNDHTKKRGRQMLLDFLVSGVGRPRHL